MEKAKEKASSGSFPAGQNAFPRTARLLKPSDFKEVFRKSSASSDRYFKVLARPNGSEGSRLGLAVSRKIDKRAVGRNRIKRVARESFRHSFNTLPTPNDESGRQHPNLTGLDLVVLPRPVCASICNRQLRQSLETHWRQLLKRFEPKGLAKEPGTIQPGKRPAEREAGRE